MLQAKYRRMGLGDKDTEWLSPQITHELAEQAAEVRQRAAAGEKKAVRAREYKVSRETL